MNLGTEDQRHTMKSGFERRDKLAVTHDRPFPWFKDSSKADHDSLEKVNPPQHSFLTEASRPMPIGAVIFYKIRQAHEVNSLFSHFLYCSFTALQ